MREFMKSVKKILISFILVIVILSCVSDGSSNIEISAADRIALNTRITKSWDSLWSNNFSDAEKSFEALLIEQPDDVSLMRGLSLSFYSQGKENKAFSLLAESIRKSPYDVKNPAIFKFLQSQFTFRKEHADILYDISNDLYNDKSVPFFAAEIYRSYLIKYHSSMVINPGKLGKVTKNIDLLTRWDVLGPFSNVSKSGESADFIDPAEMSPVTSKKHKGLDNIELKWFSTGNKNLIGNINLGAHTGFYNFSTSYVFKKIDIKDTGLYGLKLSRNGAIEVWVDGKETYKSSLYRSSDDGDWIILDFSKGYHKILMKVSCLDDLYAFSASLIPLTSEVEYTGKYIQYLSVDPSADGINDPLLNSLVNAGDFTEFYESLYWLNYYAADQDFGYSAISSCVNEGPEGAVLFKEIEYNALLLQGKKDDARNKSNEMYDISSTFAPSAEVMLNEFIDDHRLKKARTLINRMSQASYSWFPGKVGLIRIYMIEEEYKKAQNAIESLALSHADVPEVKLLLLGLVDEAPEDMVQEIIKFLNENGGQMDAAEFELELLSSGGYYSAVYKKASKLIALAPDNINIQRLYFEALIEKMIASNSNYKTIQNVYLPVLNHFPFDPVMLDEALSLSAGIYFSVKRFIDENSDRLSYSGKSKLNEMKQSALFGAKSVCGTLISVRPWDFSYRELMYELNNGTSFARVFKTRDSWDVIENYEKSVESEKYDNDAVIVLDEQTSIYFGDGASRNYHHQIIKIQSQEGLQNHGSYYMSYHPDYDDLELLDAFVLSENGGRKSYLRAGNELTFPGLAVGDYIVVLYRVDSYEPGLLSNEIWTSFWFDSFYPAYISEFNLIVPKSRAMKVTYHNIDEEEVSITRDIFAKEYSKITYLVKTRDGVNVENNGPAWQDIISWIDISTIDNWQVIVDWYQKLYRGQCLVTPEISETAVALTEGIRTDIDKMKVLYNFVANKIEYENLSFQYSGYIPQPAYSVLSDGFGDCKDKSVLLISLLHAAGIEAEIALSTPGYTGGKYFLPSPRFTHAIVQVIIDGKKILLDPTTEYFTFPQLPSNMVNSYYLPVPFTDEEKIAAVEDESADLLLQVSSDNASIDSYFVLDVNQGKNGVDKIAGEAVLSGNHAGAFRGQMQTRNEDVKKQFAADFLSGGLSGFVLLDYSSENIDSLISSPMIRFLSELPLVYNSVSSNKLTVNIPWMFNLPASLSVNYQNEERLTAMEVADSSLSSPRTQVVILDIPQGFKVQDLPRNSEFTFLGAVASFSYKVAGNKIICTRRLYVPVLNLIPEQYDEFQQFVIDTVKKEKDQVFLVR